jgi:allophanate hydrolase
MMAHRPVAAAWHAACSHPVRYTDACTKLNPTEDSTLLTLTDWRTALQAGSDLRSLLLARRDRIEAAGAAPVWISLVTRDALGQRLAELERAAAGLGPAERLARWPLYGAPFAVKDNIDAEGFATTAACPAWARRPEQSASVVRKLLDAGAVLFGKTNLDQFATGLVGTRSPYGAPHSALCSARVSGGSSSGSAVAVARGEVVFALGTDTAGSGRVPAGFNNIVGLKPTPGRIDTTGVLPACRSIDCVSVFALTVDDAAAVLGVVEDRSASGRGTTPPPGLARLPAPLRVAIPRQPLLDAELGYDGAWARALEQLRELGARVQEIDFAPLFAVARELYEGAYVAERWLVVHDLLERHPEALDPTVAAVIGRARGLSAADAFRSQYAVQDGRRHLDRLWADFDLLMVPTAPRHPTLAEVAAEPVAANAVLGTFTNFVNLLGAAALALPAGFTPARLPFGITFIGPGGSDAALTELGRRWQTATALPLGATDRRHDAAASPALPGPAAEPELRLAVVGAHLSGLALNGQLTERGATLELSTRTAPAYKLHALPGTVPPKPGLVRVGDGGHAIQVEIWRLPQRELGSLLALIPAPLGLGTLELEDGSSVHGFLCEAVAVVDAPDISRFGGWRAYLNAMRAA